MTHTFSGIIGWPVTYPGSSPIYILVKEYRSRSCCARCVYNIKVRLVVTPFTRLGSHLDTQVSDLGFRSMALNSFSLDFHPVVCLVSGHRGSHPSCTAWMLSLIAPALKACSTCLHLLLLLYHYLDLDSFSCLVCLNLELLICPSSLVLPFPITSYPQDLGFCFPSWA